MRSYVIKFEARKEAALPASNGYLLFSMFCGLTRSTPLDGVFHPDAGEPEKGMSIGFLKKDPFKSFTAEDADFSPGDFAYARASFIDDETGRQFEKLMLKRQGETVRLGKAVFAISRVFIPGEHELSMSLNPAQLARPLSSAGFRFVLFRRRGSRETTGNFFSLCRIWCSGGCCASGGCMWSPARGQSWRRSWGR